MKSRRLIQGKTQSKEKPWYFQVIFTLLFLIILALVGYALFNKMTSMSVQGVVTGSQVQVASPNAGTLTRLNVSRNDSVTKGQVLANVTNQTLEARIQAASNELEQLLSSREQVRSDVSQALRRFSIQEKIAEIQAKQATLNVEIQSASRAIRDGLETRKLRQEALNRAEELFREGALTISQVETRKLALQEANTALEDFQANRLRLQTERNGLESNIRMNQIQLKNLQKEADDFLTELDVSIGKLKGQIQTLSAERDQSTLKSGSDGIVLDLLKQEGEMVSEGERIMTISTGAEIWVEAFISPEKSKLISPGDPVEIVINGGQEKRLPGKVKGILPVLRSLTTLENTPLASSEPYAVVLVEFVAPEQAKESLQVGQRVGTIFLAKKG